GTPKPMLFDLLKPLFCTVEMQMEQGSSSFLQLLDRELGGGSVQPQLQTALTDVGQVMRSDFGDDISGKVDTIKPFYLPKRGDFDQDYVGKLKTLLGAGSQD